VRLIAATNRDLRAALEDGTFREDLYYRLNVVPIDIPPLREHKEDIPGLANLFFSRASPKIPAGKRNRRHFARAMQLLAGHYWPEHVRELQNVIERACALAPGTQLEAGDIQLDSAAQSQRRRIGSRSLSSDV